MEAFKWFERINCRISVFISLIFFLFEISSAQTIYSFDFENGMPFGWQIDDAWEIDSATNLKSQYFTFEGNNGKMAGVNDDRNGQFGETNGSLVTDFMDFNLYPNVLLSFDLYFFKGNYDGKGEEKLIILYTIDGLNWKELDKINREYKWEKYLFAVSEFIGGKRVKLAFQYSDGDNWNYGVGIDNIVFEVQPEYKISVFPPEINYYQLLKKDEKASFKYGMISYGKTPVNSLKLHYTIDNNEAEALLFEIRLPVNVLFEFDISNVGLGDHLIKSYITINDSFSSENDSFELSVFPYIPPFKSFDLDSNFYDLHSDLKKGKAICLEFFASYSPDCKLAASQINEAWKTLGNGKEKFQVYSISPFFYDNAKTLKALNWEIDYPIFEYSGFNRILWDIYNTENPDNIIPMSFLICPDTLDPGFSHILWSKIGFSSSLYDDLIKAYNNCHGYSGLNRPLQVNSLSLYPNPVKDILNISFGVNEKLNVKIYIADINGKTVKILSEISLKNSLKLSYDISELKSGTYFLNIADQTRINSSKFIKL